MESSASLSISFAGESSPYRVILCSEEQALFEARPCRHRRVQLGSRCPHPSGSPSLAGKAGEGPGEPGGGSRRSSARGTQHHNSGVNASSASFHLGCCE